MKTSCLVHGQLLERDRWIHGTGTEASGAEANMLATCEANQKDVKKRFMWCHMVPS